MNVSSASPVTGSHANWGPGSPQIVGSRVLMQIAAPTTRSSSARCGGDGPLRAEPPHLPVYVCMLCMYVCVDGRMRGCRYVDVRTYVCMHACTYPWVYGCVYGWDVWMHACMYIWMDGWMDVGWMDVRTYVCTYMRMDVYIWMCVYMISLHFRAMVPLNGNKKKH